MEKTTRWHVSLDVFEMFQVIAVFAVIICSVSSQVCRNLRSDCHSMIRFCDVVHIKWLELNCPETCGHCKRTTVQPPVTKTRKPWTTSKPSGSTITPPWCGTSGMQSGRVIGGTNAMHGSWPWQILMVYNGKGSCGGTLISPQWVVTAAHCLTNRRKEMFKIRVGEHNLKSRDSSEQERSVSFMISHPSFYRLNSDIAMMKLSKPVILNKYVQPACLPDTPVLPETECYITGWGKTRHPGSMASVLQQANMKVVDRKTCYDLNRISVKGVVIDKTMVCAGDGGMSRKSGCHGDSGGPFVCKTGGRWYVHGAVSHGSNDCNSNRSYTVFANVSHFHKWIQSTMQRY